MSVLQLEGLTQQVGKIPAPTIRAVSFHQILEFPEQVCDAYLVAFGRGAQLGLPSIAAEGSIGKPAQDWKVG